METPSLPKRRLLSPLRHRDFRLFWTGLLLSSVGSQFTQVAMAWQIYELTNSPLQLGLIGLARAVPQMFILLFGGLLADAMNRRKLMMITQGCLFFVSGSLALLTLAGHVTPLKLYAVTVFLALFSSLEVPSRQSIVTNLVPAEDLSRALAIFSTQRQIATIGGPSVAGLVLAIAGPTACYTVDAISWLIMFGSLALIRTRLPQRGGWRTITFDSLRMGLRFVWGHAVIFPFLMMDFGANIFGTVRSLFPIYARDILAVGPQGLGLLYAASAVGALLGALGLSCGDRCSTPADGFLSASQSTAFAYCSSPGRISSGYPFYCSWAPVSATRLARFCALRSISSARPTSYAAAWPRSIASSPTAVRSSANFNLALWRR
jgi:MFS family permease